MDVRVSSHNLHLASDLLSDTEKKETSEGEDEDVDRNHKHRKRALHSQSLDGDSLDQFFIRHYRKKSKPFENGYSDKGNDTTSVGELQSRFERRRPHQAAFSRAHMDFNQRISKTQPLPHEARAVRSRGNELGVWVPHDHMLGSVELTSHMFPLGPVPSGLVAGSRLPNVANAQSLSWNALGLHPGAPNGGLDALHSCGLQAALRPSISPSVNIGFPRKHCRDFEELGFCLRGDLCPMEHGVNRIIIDDVQSLSQFNLPVSRPGSKLLGTSAGQGTLPVTAAASNSFVNTSDKPGGSEDGWGLTRGFAGDSFVGGSDVYDPDQPLWTSDNPATSSLLSLNQFNADKMEPFLDQDPADRSDIKQCEGFDEHPVRSATASGSHSTSVWRRIGSSTNLEVKEKKDSEVKSPGYLARDTKSEGALNVDLQDVSPRGKQVKATDDCPQVKKASLKPRSNFARDAQKPSRKALCTLFINGIPWKDNKRESLFSHFRKFGEIVDIYIPMHSERAFVQFSKTEEAEAALKAPDAVMGNRFIKLRWANRDNIPNDRINDSSSFSTTPRRVTLDPAFSHPPSDKRKEHPHSEGIKDGSTHSSVSQVPIYDHPRPINYNGPKSCPIQQKKLENLELLKEELRKKQEMLDQKRSEFRLQLNKLEKQSIGSKVETAISSPRINAVAENVEPAGHALPHSSSSASSAVAREPSSLRPSSHPWAPPATSVANRFKLDNRPTSFKIVSPLPAGLANVAALEEHFNSYGDLSSVELEESLPTESRDAPPSCGISARISFATRRSAERAFAYGKSWKGRPLQFTWLKSNTSGKESDAPGTHSAHLKVPEVTVPIRSQNSSGSENGPENTTAGSGVESADSSKDSK